MTPSREPSAGAWATPAYLHSDPRRVRDHLSRHHGVSAEHRVPRDRFAVWKRGCHADSNAGTTFDEVSDEPRVIGFQGAPGAFSEEPAGDLVPTAATRGYRTFTML